MEAGDIVSFAGLVGTSLTSYIILQQYASAACTLVGENVVQTDSHHSSLRICPVLPGRASVFRVSDSEPNHQNHSFHSDSCRRTWLGSHLRLVCFSACGLSRMLTFLVLQVRMGEMGFLPSPPKIMAPRRATRK
jgi:hypothetical protein